MKRSREEEEEDAGARGQAAELEAAAGEGRLGQLLADSAPAVCRALLERHGAFFAETLNAAAPVHWELPLWRVAWRSWVAGHTETVARMLALGADPWLYDAAGRDMVHCLHYGECYVETKNGQIRNQLHFQVATKGSPMSLSIQHIERARQTWTPETHMRFPEAFQDQVFTLLLLNQRQPRGHRIPRDVLHVIIGLLAFDVGKFRRDPITKDILKTSTVRHLIHLLVERGLGWHSQRTSKEKLRKKLMEYAQTNGTE